MKEQAKLKINPDLSHRIYDADNDSQQDLDKWLETNISNMIERAVWALDWGIYDQTEAQGAAFIAKNELLDIRAALEAYLEFKDGLKQKAA